MPFIFLPVEHATKYEIDKVSIDQWSKDKTPIKRSKYIGNNFEENLK